MKTLTVKVSDELDVKLGAVAAQRNESKSALIRAAIERLLGADETPNAPPKDGDKNVSCLDLARDLRGCVEGAADLSHNKKHLRGYGEWNPHQKGNPP